MTTLGPDHSSVGNTCYNMAGLAEKQYDLPQALELFTRSMNIDKATYGADHPRTLEGIANVDQVRAAMA